MIFRALAATLVSALCSFMVNAEPSKSRHPPANQPSPGCGDFNYSISALGPLDYRITDPEVIDFVEVRHFTPQVERLVKGEKGTLGSEMAYMLGVFPNHHRALRSALELTKRHGGTMPPEMKYSVDCWFDRAIAYRPDDVLVRVLWAQELIRRGDRRSALQQVEIAETFAKGSPPSHYNLGLLYFELREYEKSMSNAKIAYDNGFNLPGLRDKLTKAGKWKD